MEKINTSEDALARLRLLSDRLAKGSEDEEALIERGRIYWALGKRSEAINDYLAARRINPDGKAVQLLKATYDILNFFDKDLYNP
ncbi:MAG: tetratricopeptide repeat protein [Muribaculaceae bacterium]|nr:tetratricopeptide repeat protein [Muribaculaceae bacterium]